MALTHRLTARIANMRNAHDQIEATGGARGTESRVPGRRSDPSRRLIVGPKTARTDVHAFRLSVDGNRSFVNVGRPAPFGVPVGMADVVS